MKKAIPVWHGHHNGLISWLISIGRRKRDIREYKPKSEQPLRLKLIKRVKGKLPPTLMQAWKDYFNYDKDWEAYEQAYQKHLPAIKALHAKECPNCPWDGKSIFPLGKS